MSFSYFIVDTILGVIQRYNDFWMNLHHAIIFIVYAVALRDNNVATELIITIFFGELTNPFNLLRQIFAEQEKPQQARLQGILFIASFMLFRIVLGPIFVWWICSNPSVSIIIKLGACLMRKSLSHPSLDRLHLGVENHGNCCSANLRNEIAHHRNTWEVPVPKSAVNEQVPNRVEYPQPWILLLFFDLLPIEITIIGAGASGHGSRQLRAKNVK